jgi:hypothetical protein
MGLAKSAAERVIDQALLAQIAIESENYGLARVAAERVIDQAMLTRIAADAKSAEIRMAYARGQRGKPTIE